MFENTLTFSRKFNKHDLSVLAGFTTEEYQGKNINTSTDGLMRDYLPTLSLPSASATISASEGIYANARESFLGRINYIYNDKYILTANWRFAGAVHVTQGGIDHPSHGRRK